MRLAILLSHPAQFHFYRNIVDRLKQKEIDVLVLIRTKDILSNLLDEYGWEYYNILPDGRGNSRIQILYGLFKRTVKIWFFVKKRKIDFLAGTDASLAIVGKFCRIPCITTLEDDYEVIKHLANLTYPFTANIVVPAICSVGKWGYKKVGYQGYMKLAYLHPNWFTPDIRKISISPDKPFYILRLSALNAHHDVGIKGINEEILVEIIKRLAGFGSVFISSESELPINLKKFHLHIPTSDLHHYLSLASLLVCDSQSMAVEAAMLGTPSLRFSSFAGRISVLEELEHKYQLTYGIKPDEPEKLFAKIAELLAIPKLKEEFQNRRQRMLADKIDVTAFMVWFIEKYPESKRIMQEDPDYQFNFR